MPRIRGKLTYANVISTLCLVLVGDSAYAATQMLPKNSVGAKQIKKGAITPSKLSKSAKSKLVGPRVVPGPQGKEGPQGNEGPAGKNLTTT